MVVVEILSICWKNCPWCFFWHGHIMDASSFIFKNYKMTITQHAHIYSFHTSNFILEKVFFNFFYIEPLVGLWWFRNKNLSEKLSNSFYHSDALTGTGFVYYSYRRKPSGRGVFHSLPNPNCGKAVKNIGWEIFIFFWRELTRFKKSKAWNYLEYLKSGTNSPPPDKLILELSYKEDTDHNWWKQSTHIATLYIQQPRCYPCSLLCWVLQVQVHRSGLTTHSWTICQSSTKTLFAPTSRLLTLRYLTGIQFSMLPLSKLKKWLELE